MRQIKFRAWDKEFEGGTMTYSDERLHLEDFFCYHEGQDLMQFTGLLDKNGKEIYEGDKCKFWYKIKEKVSPKELLIEQVLEVQYGFHEGNRGESSSFYGWLEIHDGYISPLEDRQKWTYQNPYWDLIDWGYEIIGNIYENPKILKIERR